MLKVLQLSDLHLFSAPQTAFKALVNPYQQLKRIIAQIQEEGVLPDLTVITGDVAQDETAEAYQQAKSLLQTLPGAKVWLPGNHDEVTFMQQEEWWQAQTNMQGWQFLFLNSQLPGEVAGKLSESALSALSEKLKSASDTPTGIFLHHPPVAVGSTWMDAIGLLNGSELLKVIDQAPQVQWVAFGHVHHRFATVRNGVAYLAAPSTCLQFQPEAAQVIFDELPPGFRWFFCSSNGRFTTEVKRIGTKG